MCRSINITYRKSSLMAANFWSSLVLRLVVPDPRPARKIWRKYWYMMEAVSQKFRITTTTVHTATTRPITQYYILPLGISTTTYHVASSAIRRSPKAALTTVITFYHFVIYFLVPVYPSTYVSSSPGPLVASAASSADISDSASNFRASSSQPLT